MKKQQEQAKAQALKEKEQLAEGNDNTTNAPAPTAPRRSTRQGAKPDNNAESAVSEGRGIRKTKKGQKGKYTTSGFAGSIFSYFKKADTEVKDDNPTVQEALANAADELEAHPTAIGQRQDLVATQQPRLVTGGEMKEYQLEVSVDKRAVRNPRRRNGPGQNGAGHFLDCLLQGKQYPGTVSHLCTP